MHGDGRPLSGHAIADPHRIRQGQHRVMGFVIKTGVGNRTGETTEGENRNQLTLFSLQTMGSRQKISDGCPAIRENPLSAVLCQIPQHTKIGHGMIRPFAAQATQ